MCGIFGYKWTQRGAEALLLHGLERLEYRGYDSAGLWVSDGDGNTQLIKAVGKVSELASRVAKEVPRTARYTMGIAHTRRATHGGITLMNTHPHQDMHGNFTVVHNGIIENYHKLKQELISKWYSFYGETDTEVIADLLDANWTGNFLETVEKTVKQLRGAYALLIVCKHAPQEMIGIKRWSPFVFGYDSKGNYYFSSDKQALAWYAEKSIHLEDGELVHVTANNYTIKTGELKVYRKFEDVDCAELAASKGEYKHFMLKEIFEQPAILNRICKGRVRFDTKQLMAEAFHGMQDETFQKVVFVGCGTSYNAGRLWTYWMQDIAWLDSYCEIASEYEYKHINVSNDTLYVFISQSGETADSIGILQKLKAKGAHTFGIVNTVWSTISRLTDHWLFTRCGTEIGVASTKAFSGQLMSIMLLALFLGKKRWLTTQRYEQLLAEIEKIPWYISQILDTSDAIQKVAQELATYKNFFFLGRHYEVPIAAEISLKYKEITYLHAESYPAGELKHGPLAMIDKNIPCIMCIPNDVMFEKNMSSLQEIKARNGKVLAISDKEVTADWYLLVPKTCNELYPFLCNVVGQLLSYYAADYLDRNIDKPRNLAKSVTVK